MKAPRYHIYTGTLVFILALLASLPFIYIDISVKSNGIVQAAHERAELFAPLSGRILDFRMVDNQEVRRGDTLLVIDSSLPEQQIESLNERILQLKKLQQDVALLLQLGSLDSYNLESLKTGQFAASFNQFREEEKELNNRLMQAQKVYSRYKELFDKKLLSLSEFEKLRADLDGAIYNHKSLVERRKVEWEIQYAGFQEEIRKLESQKAEILEQKKFYILRSSQSGTLQSLAGLQKGSTVFSNQKIAEVSPKTALVGFCYVSPADIGMIHSGQTVLFQIHAFNYNNWGTLSGLVVDVSDDVLIVDNKAMFKVKCLFSKTSLESDRGFKGLLKKGMTFTAHFQVTKRSLYQLLYDQVDDWLNPHNGRA